MSSDMTDLLLVKGGIMGEIWPIKFSLMIVTSTEIVRDFLHAAKLQNGTDSFTSPPKEGMLRIFLTEKFDSFGWVWTHELRYQRPAR
jgi:hypothetical protein